MKRTTNHLQQFKSFVLSGFCALIIATVFIPTPAHADLTILPIRVLMEGRERNSELTLVNSSATTNTYRLEWRHRRMKEVGGYEHLDAPLNPIFDPDKTIMFSPKQVTIAPGQTQRVRLSVRKPADLPDGEYRAHLVLKKVAIKNPINKKGQPGLAVQVNTNVGFSIPVVVRQGPYDANVKITKPQFLPPNKPGASPAMSLVLKRTGLHSISGTLRVYWTPIGEAERIIGQTKNVNVFHEIDERLIGVTLKENNITSGTIRIAFEGERKKKGVVYDEQRFPVGR